MRFDNLNAWTFIDGEWLPGNPPILGALSHGTWMASVVFDGARRFEGVTPDLDMHCQRINESAEEFGLKAVHAPGEMMEIAQDGFSRFEADTPLYIRPMLWAEEGFVDADPESTRFCLSLFEAPMPKPDGFSVCLSPFQRPLPNMAPTKAKASCLYPNSGRALRDAIKRGFDNAVVLDGLGNVAELATANLWIGKDGAAHTPAINGTFLNGVTRRRLIQLFEAAGIKVHQRTISWQEVQDADEVFSSGNHAKVMPITKVAERDLQPGPLFHKARELYWDYAHR